MYIIVGLGNPTRQYEGTKHNVGFDTIDYLIDEYQIPSSGAGQGSVRKRYDRRSEGYCGKTDDVYEPERRVRAGVGELLQGRSGERADRGV